MSNPTIADKTMSELEALREFYQAAMRMDNTPIVDDDFPEMKHYYHRAAEKAKPLVGTMQADFLNSLRKANVARCTGKDGFDHALDNWSLLEWAGAMCGESGEAANVAKKIKRIVGNTRGNQGQDNDLQYLKEKLAKEVADVVIYGDLILADLGVSLQQIVTEVFDTKSVELDCPYFLAEE